MIKSDKKRKSRSGSKSQSAIPAFLVKTYEILENPAYADIISWNKEGNAFVVKKINEFAEKILPKYFKHNNFASFVRQLNMYDFHKARQDNNENEFKHRLFRRGQKHLLAEIKRKTADVSPYPNNQLVPVTKEIDYDKLKKDCSAFSSELGSLKARQAELEKITKLIYGQNNQLIKENKILWNELIKNKEKYERKIEKLMLFIFSIMHYSGNPQISSFINKKGLTADYINEALGDLANDDKGSADKDKALSIIPGKGPKDNNKLLERIMKYLHNKGEEGNLDALIENLPGAKTTPGEYPQILEDTPEDDHDLTSTIDLSKKKKSKGRRVSHMIENEEYMPEEFPKKQVKTEAPSLPQTYTPIETTVQQPSPFMSPNPLLSPNPQIDLAPSPSYNFQREPSLGDLNLGRQNSIPNYFETNSPRIIPLGYNQDQKMEPFSLEKQDSEPVYDPNFFNPNLFINTNTNSPGPNNLEFKDDILGYDKL